MSSVRMCDKCGTVFSELADGWQTYSATTVQRRKRGEAGPMQTTQTVMLDACPSCAMTVDDAPSARTPLLENDGAFARLALEKENAELREQVAAASGATTDEAPPAVAS